MATQEQIENYWNDIQDWFTLMANPVKIQMDKLFMKTLIHLEKFYTVKPFLELNDITDPIQYRIQLGANTEINIYINDIHNIYAVESDNLVFNEEYFDKFDVKDTTFDVGVANLQINNVYIDGWAADDINYDSLKLFVESLHQHEPKEFFDSINDLPKDEFNYEMYKLTNDDQYLSQEAKDMFLF